MATKRQDILNELVRLQKDAEPILNMMVDERIKKFEGMRDNKSLIKFLYDEIKDVSNQDNIFSYYYYTNSL